MRRTDPLRTTCGQSYNPAIFASTEAQTLIETEREIMKVFSTRSPRLGRHGNPRPRLPAQRGSVVIIATVFIVVFAALAVALYWLVTSQTRATETERTDVKAFNVAEAGIDAGMLALKLDWPGKASTPAYVDIDLLRTTLRSINPGLWLPTDDGTPTGEPTAIDFLNVLIYDNVDPQTGETTTVANASAPAWDSNGDGRMFIDSTANVDNDRHRILVLAERQQWNLMFPATLALWASAVDSNGQGLEVYIEKGTPPIYYDVHDAQHKGVDPQPPDQVLAATPSTFDSVVSEQLRLSLEKVARDAGTYFEGADAGDRASTFLASGEAGGKVVYVKSNTAVVISGRTQIGTEKEPVVVVIDTPDGTTNTWDLRGTGDFYGLLVTIGHSTLRGTSGIHGALYCSGTVANKGNGSCGEIAYNQQVINNINGQYVISVNLVPNTWEEYTLPLEAED
jgi:hypothetical protein